MHSCTKKSAMIRHLRYVPFDVKQHSWLHVSFEVSLNLTEKCLFKLQAIHALNQVGFEILKVKCLTWCNKCMIGQSCCVLVPGDWDFVHHIVQLRVIDEDQDYHGSQPQHVSTRHPLSMRYKHRITSTVPVSKNQNYAHGVQRLCGKKPSEPLARREHLLSNNYDVITMMM